jgi:hypothetical protein
LRIRVSMNQVNPHHFGSLVPDDRSEKPDPDPHRS